MPALKTKKSNRKSKERPKKTATVEMPEPKEHGIFSARDGTPIYYEVAGEGRPLIFCYGLMCQRSHWRYQLKHFAKHYQIITFDYRGHQRSGLPRNDRHLTLEWCAHDVQDLIQYLHLQEAVCLGHSLGVAVSALAAEMEPKTIKGIVLVCGSVMNPFQHMFFSSHMDTIFNVAWKTYETAPDLAILLWKKFSQRNRLSVFLASQFGFNPTLAQEEDVHMYIDGVNQTPVATFFTLMRDYTQTDGRPKLRDVHCPALVIAGEDDCVTPMYIQEEMAELLPKGEFEKIPNGSHNAHMDRPTVVNRRIEQFFSKIKYK